MEDFWSTCLQTHDVQTESVDSIPSSHDKCLMVTASREIQIWDTIIGVCMRRIQASRPNTEDDENQKSDDNEGSTEIPEDNQAENDDETWEDDESMASSEFEDAYEYPFLNKNSLVTSACSQNNKHLVTALASGIVFEFCLLTGEYNQIFSITPAWYSNHKLLLSHNATRLASTLDSTIQVWMSLIEAVYALSTVMIVSAPLPCHRTAHPWLQPVQKISLGLAYCFRLVSIHN